MIPPPRQPIVAFGRRGPWALRLGATPEPGGLRLRVWAPRARAVDAVLEDGRRVPLEAGEDGVWEGLAPGARAGARYGFSLDGGPVRADPTSRFQPDGPHALSEAIDPAFPWRDAGWKGISLREAVLYEAHVGAFSPRGDYGGLAARLPHLKGLGVSVLELMPVAQNPGRRNWGYDGALLFAPHHAYGRPEELKRLVDACHRAGVAVCLDVVYNHLGPEGNYLPEFGPYLTERYRTPWSPAVNFDGPDSDAVRRWAIENALYWITEFHVDALRLDAIQEIYDRSPRHILAEMKAAVAEQARRLGRRVWLVAETDEHDSRVIRPVARGGWGLDAEWADDFHHALHVHLTGERGGYYADFAGLADAARALREGYAFEGSYSRYRRRRYGSPAGDLPAERFVFCIQNHDQIGNRASAGRIGAFAGLELQKACAALLLLAPQTPLLFMGEEWGELNPFYFFTDHRDPGLGEAVRRGRAALFKKLGWDAAAPDPQEPATMEESKLDWGKLKRQPHAGVLAVYKELLRIRRSMRTRAHARAATAVRHGPGWLAFERRAGARRIAVVANLGDEPIVCPFEGKRLLSTRDKRFGGPGAPEGAPGRVPGRSAVVLA